MKNGYQEISLANNVLYLLVSSLIIRRLFRYLNQDVLQFFQFPAVSGPIPLAQVILGIIVVLQSPLSEIRDFLHFKSGL